ncbi:MAG: histidine kinase [Saprospiraceae bacterium]|nr:histidine kinase [Saprospiraceae bacterium]
MAWLVCRVGWAQQPFSKNYQVKEGLLSNYTYFVFQDSKGYIWIGSDVGVSRFDGHTFTNYNTAQGLSDNEVFSLYEDRKGRIWCATLNGKPCFFQDGRLYSEKNMPFLKKCDLRGLVFRIFEKPNGELVYAAGSRFLEFNLDKNTYRFQEIPLGLTNLWQQPKGILGGLSATLAYEFSPDGQCRETPIPSLSAPVRTQRIGDTVLIGNLGQITLYDFNTRRTVSTLPLFDKHNEIIYLNHQNGLVWVGTRNGIFAYEYPSFRRSRQLLAGLSVSSMLLDREGGYWFSTLEKGLVYIPEPDILHYTKADGLLYDRIICLARDARQRLWIGSEGSTFAIYDGKTIRTRQILRESIKNKTIFNIRHVADGTSLVVGKVGTLMLRNDKEEYLYQRASDLNIDANGNIWSGLTGLYFIPKADIPHKIFPLEWLGTPGDEALYAIRRSRQVSDLRVEKIEFDAAQRVWLATSTGLYAHLPALGHQEQVLPHVTKDILFDANAGLLWALTESNGLFALRDGRVIDSIGIANNRGSVICRDLCRDDSGRLWIGSAGGLFCVAGAPGHLRLNNYWGVFGLFSEKINAVEVIGDQVFIGKDDGFLQIPQHVLSQAAGPPTVHLTALRVNNESLGPSLPEQLDIDYGRQPLAIEFEGLSYRELQNIRYRYRLAGFDDSWHTTTNRAVEYAALRPGTYCFEVFAINSSGVSSLQPLRVRWQVLRPFWLKTWFWALVLGAAAAGVAAYVRARERAIRRKFEIERRLMESSRQNAELQHKNTKLRMLALRLQMNPHFIFNALNTVKGYYGQEKFVEANAFIGKFARLLRLNLDYSDALIPLEQEIELLNIYIQLSQTRFPGKIRFQLDIDPRLHPMDTRIPSMLLQPFVENAVIHGIVPKPEPGTVFLSFEKQDDALLVLVRDDGIGRAASASRQLRDPHKPLATQITLERLQLLRPGYPMPPLEIRDLYDAQGQAAGTEVRLHIPLQHHTEHDQRPSH